jgi:tRNA threonylcarbamoyladenosine modification (KEOPS) complex  Pcc1 subunit
MVNVLNIIIEINIDNTNSVIYKRVYFEIHANYVYWYVKDKQ